MIYGKISYWNSGFPLMRKEGFLYVDKTELIYRMMTTGVAYFLSRPRRFGKSLLVSTLEAIFKGKRELFNSQTWNLLPKTAIYLANSIRP